MGDLGIPGVKLQMFKGYLPNVTKFVNTSTFDVNSAMMNEYIKDNEERKPDNIEFLSAGNMTFGTAFPSRQIIEIDNIVRDAPSPKTAGKKIIWSIRTANSGGVFAAVGPGYPGLFPQSVRNQEVKLPSGYDSNYNGPRFETVTLPKTVNKTQDQPAVPSGDRSDYTEEPPAVTAPTPATDANMLAEEYVQSANQMVSTQDLWWALETNSLIQIPASDSVEDDARTSAVGDDRLYRNMPFYLDIDRSAPLSKDMKTFVLVRFNPPACVPENNSTGQLSSNESVIDILLVDGELPRLYDWNTSRKALEISAHSEWPRARAGDKATPPEAIVLPITGNLSAPGKLRIGILPVLGKLAIYFDDQVFVYSRVNCDQTESPVDAQGMPNDDSQAFVPIKFVPDTIRVVGSNCQTRINLSAMGFKDGQFVSLMPATDPLFGSEDGANPDATSAENLFKIPKVEGSPSDGVKKYDNGVDCRLFRIKDGSVSANNVVSDRDVTLTGLPEWAGNHGVITLSKKADKRSRNTIGSGQSTDAETAAAAHAAVQMHYEIAMSADAAYFGVDVLSDGSIAGPQAGSSVITPRVKLKRIAPPFFFRLRGLYYRETTFVPPEPVDFSKYLVSFNESFSSSDRCLVKHTVEMTLYNPSGVLDSLLKGSLGVVLSMNSGPPSKTILDAELEESSQDESESGEDTPIFTGVSLGGTKSEVAGKETISIRCEDYMVVLEHTLMINSPFYDGMDLFNAVFELARRAGIKAYDGTPQTPRPYLPMGYSFTAPAMRFPGRSHVQQNIAQICAMYERVVYFDNFGRLCLDVLQGGLAITGNPTISHAIVSDPSRNDHVIIDEKITENVVGSTVNGIRVKTVDRLNMDVILIGDDARDDPGYDDSIPYHKILLYDQPAFGSFYAAQNWMNLMRERVYKPIYGITVKILNPGLVKPLQFMTVDEYAYRITSFTRAYSADDNSHVGTLVGEWFGTLRRVSP